MDHEDWIYESPDKGDTVYRRRPGSTHRQMVREGILRKKLTQQQKWHEILQAAESDPELKKMIDQAEVYWRLKCKQ